ncbi:uncharacterized protein LOC119663067 [Teleopsis dalmanni]|uniref:uncharacterized protein LOC119663067 n=1 Tax=Teleopsis dalmanni TaxID=139649 RepID=UPI0018CEE81A|nr:uncharacterized protein LOC119663067 [Teleopsis dalmanni]
MLVGSRNREYDEASRELALNLYLKSRSAYLFMRNKLNLTLPHENSIINWTPIKNLQPGFKNECFHMLAKKISMLRQIDRENAILIVDEMKLRPELRYNSVLDQIDGFEDVDFFRTDKIGKSICLFIVKGMFSNWSFILNYFITENGMDGDCLSNIILENLRLLKHELGTIVRVISCDQGSANRKTFSTFEIVPEKPFFDFEDNKIFCMYDFPHLIKCLRNGLMTCDLTTADGIVSFKVLNELWERERYATTKMCPKLSRQHIEPKNFEKMRVKFATQLFSKTVQAAIRTIVGTGGFNNVSNEVAVATANFIEKIDKIFDCMNSCTLYSKNPYSCALQVDGIVINYIKEFILYFNSVKFTDPKKTVHFLTGFKITLNGVVQLAEEIFRSNSEIFFIMTNFLCQDKLENTFSILRQRGGYNKNPSVSEINYMLAKVITRKILLSTTVGNCETVEDDNVFQSVVDEEISPSNEVSLIVHETNDNSGNQDEISIQNTVMSYISENHDVLDSELPSLRYFLGYVASRVLPKLSCSSCNKSIRKSNEFLTAPTELFLFYKNYNKSTDFGKLVAPTEEFVNVSCKHVSIFKKMFKQKPETFEIRKVMREQCILSSPSWFIGACRLHRIELLDFILLILLRKHCIWMVEKVKSTKA